MTSHSKDTLRVVILATTFAFVSASALAEDIDMKPIYTRRFALNG